MSQSYEALGQISSTSYEDAAKIAPKFLQFADIVISSINTKKPIISLDIAKLSIEKRKGRPIFFVDLGVPRNIEESIGSLESSFLYTIDDLKVIVDSNIGSRSEASIEAEEIVNFKTSDFLEWEKIQSIDQFINCYLLIQFINRVINQFLQLI